ncbi:MAG: 2-amino-4-hydroxy-6-hydroxymethyldihydropteridine diphosphokinase [Pseudomonadota bacterium]
MSETELRTAYLGLGGNVGDVKAAMRWALEQIERLDQTSIFAISPLYKTPPWGIKTQNWFLNACVGIKTSMPPHALLRALIDIEKQAGRIRSVRWGPRTLDIDILMIDNLSIQTPRLMVPHPRMLERAFVMTPLADIAGGLTINGKTIRSISNSIADPEMEIADANWSVGYRESAS